MLADQGGRGLGAMMVDNYVTSGKILLADQGGRGLVAMMVDNHVPKCGESLGMRLSY